MQEGLLQALDLAELLSVAATGAVVVLLRHHWVERRITLLLLHGVLPLVLQFGALLVLSHRFGIYLPLEALDLLLEGLSFFIECTFDIEVDSYSFEMP